MRAPGTWAAALMLLTAACGGGGDPDDHQPQPDVQPVVGARTVVVEVQRFEVTVDAIGSVTPRAGSFASLSAPLATRVAHVYVAEGDRVRQGDPLIEFERAPIDAEAQRAEAARAAAQHAYDRAARLAADGILPRKDVDQAAADLGQAEVAFLTARRTQELAILRAPLSGVVSRMTAVSNAPADAGQPLVEVVDPSALEVRLELSPRDAAEVRAGAPVAFYAGEDAHGDSLGAGVVVAVGAQVDSVGRSVAVRARLVRVARSLRIGESIVGRIRVAVHAAALAVPSEALVPDGAGVKVFVVDTAGVVHGRPVTVGVRSSAQAEIVGGLARGERVVTYGAYGMEDGATLARPRPRP